MLVGIVILSWNSKDMIDVCLSGLLKYESSPVYVVDNGSEDGSPEFIEMSYPSVKLIRSPANLGFAAGNNLAIKQALLDGCNAVFLLNNDTIIDEEFLAPCVQCLDNDATVGVCGPVIVEGYQPDLIQCSGGRIHPWTLGFPYIRPGQHYERRNIIETVDYVLGAAILIRREVIEKTGGLDAEYFPAYVEEADLCYRAQSLGYKSVVTHAARVRHIGDSSSGSYDNSFRRYTSNRFLFGLKHLNPLKFLTAGLLLISKVFVKKIIKAIK